MGQRVGGEAGKAGREISRWYGDFVYEKGAWNAWLRSKDWLGMGWVPMLVDHDEENVLATLADTKTGTLGFKRKEVGSEEWLEFEAEIRTADDGPPAPTVAQTDAVSLIAQGLVTDVSMGFYILEYHWELARDPDNDRDVDTLIGEKLAAFEISLVVRGAFKEDSKVRLLDKTSASDAGPVRMGVEMREMMRTPSGASVPFPVEQTRAEANKALDDKLAERAAIVIPAEDVERVLQSTTHGG